MVQVSDNIPNPNDPSDPDNLPKRDVTDTVADVAKAGLTLMVGVAVLDAVGNFAAGGFDAVGSAGGGALPQAMQETIAGPGMDVAPAVAPAIPAFGMA